MLIEFSVTNFRSFRERQTLSMVATSRIKNKRATFAVSLRGEKFPDLLKTAVIYGPNASGKSNLLKAFASLKAVVMAMPGPNPSLLPVNPFRFDPVCLDSPTEFDIHFVCGEIRYQFELHVTSERIVFERLVSYPEGRETLIYTRRYVHNKESYEFGNLDLDSLILETWRRITPPNVLFLSQAVSNSNEDFFDLTVPFLWLRDSTLLVLNGMDDLIRSTQKLISDEEWSDRVSEFLRGMDIPISRIRSEISESKMEPLRGLAGFVEGPQNKIKLSHKTALGEVEFDFSEESDGTKNLIGFWLPWTRMSFSNSSKNKILVVDELDSSLHPKIVELLIEKHFETEKVSQLIFTSHNTHLMDSKLMRRDQIWLTERDVNGATQLRSVHDFEGREGEDIEKRYYAGRYRALPIL